MILLKKIFLENSTQKNNQIIMKGKKIKKIGVITSELNLNHLSYYHALSHLFDRHEVTFYSYRAVKDSMNCKVNNWILRREKESSINYFFRIRKKLSEQDLIIAEEPFGGTILILFLSLFNLRKKTILTIHNVNKWFLPKMSFSLKMIFYTLVRNKIKNNVSAYIVISPNLKKYILKSGLTQKPVYFLPFSIPTSDNKLFKENDGVFRFCIPGSVDLKRRDYSTVIKAFSKALSGGSLNLELYLLGKANSEKPEVVDLLNQCDSINKIFKKKIFYWTNYVPENEYERVMQIADSFILNINSFYQRSTSIEIYGITKETGILYAALNYQKRLIATYTYTLPYELMNNSQTYMDVNELTELLVTFENLQHEDKLVNDIDSFNKVYKGDFNKLISSC
ncbi:hypothetical protein [uncultured Winogradskyella sp.]|uniref:hypothetical protein n=1 Tax=uncultured Winogradskyella sp. TaxID=395353 RepID=UPI0030DA6102|tara:strand:- start:17259 stop:18440 length:1182 start_codon:yes stop_codon:yes gene_type:complete